MALKLITAPLAEPLTLAEVKQHLRVDHTEEDGLIAIYIRAAREHAERFLGRALVSQTWDLYLDAFPVNEIRIPLPPLRSVESIRYDDTAGEEQTVSTLEYYVDTANEPGWVVPDSTTTWPTTIDAVNAVRIRFVAGYAPTADSPEDLASNVPWGIKAAMLLIIGNLYENRENNVVGVITNKLPHGAEWLLRPYRIELSMA